jgi:hypothetical protein
VNLGTFPMNSTDLFLPRWSPMSPGVIEILLNHHHPREAERVILTMSTSEAERLRDRLISLLGEPTYA